MLQILQDNLTNPTVISILEEHLADMKATSPPESVHALDIEQLQAPKVQFWVAWEVTLEINGQEKGEVKTPVGCAALKQLSATEAELKSMRTKNEVRGKGYGKQLLKFVLEQAALKGMKRIYLETGSQDFFAPARKLYQNQGFVECGPFAQYTLDPNSQFFCLDLENT